MSRTPTASAHRPLPTAAPGAPTASIALVGVRDRFAELKHEPHRILGVDRHARPEEVRAAYKRLALRYHPDRNRGDPVATEVFQRVNAAYGSLINALRLPDFDGMSATEIAHHLCELDLEKLLAGMSGDGPRKDLLRRAQVSLDSMSAAAALGLPLAGARVGLRRGVREQSAALRKLRQEPSIRALGMVTLGPAISASYGVVGALAGTAVLVAKAMFKEHAPEA